MGKVYSAPASIKEPKFHNANGDFDYDDYNKEIERYRKEVVDCAKKNGKGKYAGKIISFGVADGSADYVIVSLKPVWLIHLNDMDGYQFQYVDRLTATDIRQKIEQEEEWHKALTNAKKSKATRTSFKN